MTSDLLPFPIADYPLQSHLGYRFLEWREGFAKFDMPIQEFHGNRYGLPHGGLYVTLLDTVMGYSGSFTGSEANPKFAMTLSITTNFLSRPKGKVLIAEGWTTGGGKSTFFAESKCYDETGELCATGVGTFRLRGPK